MLTVLPVVWAFACSGHAPAGNSAVQPGMENVVAAEAKSIKFLSPAGNSETSIGKEIVIELAFSGKDAPDSVRILFNGRKIKTLVSTPWSCKVTGDFNISTGRKPVKAVSFSKGQQEAVATQFITVLSDIVPVRYGYKVVKSYPHDREAFTQGLVYDRGNILEGTGQKGSSNLREYNIDNGKIIRQHNLDASLFGEGITVFNGKIYQVTWEDKRGFVYDRNTFNVLNMIYYRTEGWGLATVGNRIAMSDGSNIITYYDPEMFTSLSELEVYDNEKKVDKLNELEYIKGEIWANIWMSDLIARIDTASGKVTGYIDLTGLLPGSERNADTDVLNGIAWDSSADRIFVTGKRWPEIYEIRVLR